MVHWWFPQSKNWTARARLAWEVVMAGQSWLLIIMRYSVYVCVCIVLTSKFHKLYRSYLQTVRKRTCPTQKPPAFQTFYIILPWLELFQSHEFLTPHVAWCWLKVAQMPWPQGMTRQQVACKIPHLPNGFFGHLFLEGGITWSSTNYQLCRK